jgi:hypothetical protein
MEGDTMVHDLKFRSRKKFREAAAHLIGNFLGQFHMLPSRTLSVTDTQYAALSEANLLPRTRRKRRIPRNRTRLHPRRR